VVNSQAYTVAPAEWEKFKAAVYADPNCHILRGESEDVGELFDHSPVGTITLSYLHGNGTLVVTLVSKPWEVSSGSVFKKITSLIESVTAPKGALTE